MKSTVALLALSISLFAAPAGAEEFVGFMGGPSLANLGLGLKYGIGFETGAKLEPNWSLGFLINFNKLGTNNGSADSASLATFLGGVTYHGWPNNQGPYAGIRAGVGVVNSDDAVTELASIGGLNTSFAIGLVGGYDKKLGDEFTWGPQAQLIAVKNDGGNLYVFNVLLCFHYWPE